MLFAQLRRARQAYWNFRPFSDNEAWGLFRIAAIGEAVGWTLLIAGILCSQINAPWHDIPVQIAGRIHGMLFLLYVAAVLVLSPSLRWSWPRVIIAGACSAPPYGSLLYEQWSAQRRLLRHFRLLRYVAGYKSLTSLV